MNKNIIFGIILVVVAGGAFWGGIAYATSGTPTSTRGQFTGAGGAGGFAGRGGAGRTGGGFTAGTIVSSGNGSISIQSMMSSSTEIVLVGNSTQVFKTVSGSQSDLTPGANVVITGTPNSDGSMTAQSIQIRPAGMSG